MKHSDSFVPYSCRLLCKITGCYRVRLLLRHKSDQVQMHSVSYFVNGRVSALYATTRSSTLPLTFAAAVGVAVCHKLSHTATPSLTIIADQLGLNAQRSVSTTLVSERAISARKIKAAHASSLNGPFMREEVCDLASVVVAERPAVAGFTAAHYLNGRGAPGACAPLSASSAWTTDSTDIHLPPSRLLPRATPGCTGCAKRGWRRVSLGHSPAAMRPDCDSAGRRPLQPGVARGLTVASTAAASNRARRGRRALIFARLGPGSWPRRGAGAPRPRSLLNARPGDRNGHRPAGAGRWPRTAGAVRPTRIAGFTPGCIARWGAHLKEELSRD